MKVLPIEIKNLSFTYAGSDTAILKDVNLRVHPGEIIGITGLSGSGKTTLALAICGLLERKIEGVFNGQVEIYGRSVFDYTTAQIGTRVGLIFQNPDNQLFSTTVFHEVIFGPENLCLGKQEIQNRAQYSLSLTGIQDLSDRHPCQLSGGEKHLVALASILSLDPDILIFDEVMSQLDLDNVKRVQKIISTLKKIGKSIIIIDHELSRLKQVDELYLMEKGNLVHSDTGKVEDYYKALLADIDILE